VRTINLLETPMPSALLLDLDSKSGRKRAEEWLERFRDLCASTDDLETIHRELFAALTGAVTSTRIPDPKARNGWTYALLPDATTRITAARLLLSYLAGLPPSQSDIRVAHIGSGAGDRTRRAIDQLAELEAMGITAGEILQDIDRQRSPMRLATPVETEAP
jgi:hypothetical protein